MKSILSAALIFLSLFTYAQKNDKNAQPRKVNGSFSQIHVSTGIHLYLTQGNTETVSVSANDEKYLENFITEVKNGVLKIYYDNKNNDWGNDNKRELNAYVSIKTLEKLKASSGSDVSFESNISSTDLTVDISSGASVAGSITTSNLSVDQSSGSSSKLSGTADNTTITVSSGASFDGFNLVTNNCNATGSSGADVNVTVNKELVARVSSGASVDYKGTATQKDIDKSSGGSVRKVKG